jgi:two-component system, sporulation sensor kinase D
MEFLKRTDYLGPFTLLFVLVSLLLSLLSLGVFYVEELRLKEEVDLEKGTHEILLKTRLFSGALEHYEGLLQVVLSNRFLTDYLDAATLEAYENAADFFYSIARSDRHVMQLRYLDETGQERIRVERSGIGRAPLLVGRQELQMKGHRDYFTAANRKKPGELYVSKLDLNIEHGRIELPHRPVLRFAYPVFSGGVHRGIVIINVFMKDLLDELVASQLFHLYLYDAEHCLLYSNDAAYPNWMRYTGDACRFDTAPLLLQRTVQGGSSSETLSLGLGVPHPRGWQLGYLSDVMLTLTLIILPLAFVLAYVLARIPKRLYDELEEQQKIMLQQSKLAAMGEMVGAIAHQWRQPLNAVGVLAQEMQLKFERDALKKEEGRALTEELQGYLEYMSQTIEDFRNFFKPSKQKQTFDIVRAIDASLEIVRTQLDDHGIVVTVETQKPDEGNRSDSAWCVVDGYESEFRQVIVNILNNAREAIEAYAPPAGLLEKRIDICVLRTEGEIVVRIRDTGGGIPEAIMGTIFEPYVSTKYEQQGTGLGLYLSKMIIERNMSGLLRVRNAGEGAEFEILLHPF